MSYIMGIDLGTGSLKGILVSKKKEVICIKSASYDIISEVSGYREQRPSDWVDAMVDVFHQMKAEVADFEAKLEAVCISGQMHSLVLLDKDDAVIRPAILWNDTRNTIQSKRIMEVFGDELLEITKNRSLEGFTLPKLLWVKENENHHYESTKTILLPKDFLAFSLGAQKTMEPTDASGTLLYDIQKGVWSDTICDQFDINRKILPTLVKTGSVIGEVKLGGFEFNNKVKIISGAADNAAAALAAGIIDDSMAMCSIGTSGVFLAHENDLSKNYEGKLHYFSHAEGMYYAMGVTLAAGYSLDHYKSIVAPSESFDRLIDEVKHIDVGSNGLLFTPYIVGERTPHFDSEIRGALLGIDANHTRAHITRAILEGITFSLKDSKKILENNSNRQYQKIVSLGGAAKNQLWLQMQADIFNANIYTLNVEEGPALGSAMIAVMSLKWYDSLEECVANFVTYNHAAQPSKEANMRYEDIYLKYRSVYESTKSVYNQ